MRKIIPVLLLLFTWSIGRSQLFTEFYVQTTGNNLNSGSSSSDTATFTATGGLWTNATGWFYKEGIDAIAGGVTVGDWASVYPDAATTNVFVGRVTARTETNITVSLLIKTGVSPPDDFVGATTIKVGGAWKGPGLHDAANTNANMFPFNFVCGLMTNTSRSVPRVNFKNGVTYSITNAMVHGSNGPVIFQGYTTTPGDGGKAVIDGSVVFPGYVLLTILAAGAQTGLKDIIFQNNGTNGATDLVNIVGNNSFIHRCKFIGGRRNGLMISAAAVAVECEAYGCGLNNTAGAAGFNSSGGTMILVRCLSHDNKTNVGNGFSIGGAAVLTDCIAVSNINKGFLQNFGAIAVYKNCDSFGNSSDGWDCSLTTAIFAYAENCNFINNRGYGVNFSGTALRMGGFENLGFPSTDSGSWSNLSGSFAASVTNGSALQLGTNVTYAVNTLPYVDQSTGNYSITNTSLGRLSGAGMFLQTAPIANTRAYPDIGAGRHLDATNAPSGSSGGSYPFAQ